MCVNKQVARDPSQTPVGSRRERNPITIMNDNEWANEKNEWSMHELENITPFFLVCLRLSGCINDAMPWWRRREIEGRAMVIYLWNF